MKNNFCKIILVLISSLIITNSFTMEQPKKNKPLWFHKSLPITGFCFSPLYTSRYGNENVPTYLQEIIDYYKKGTNKKIIFKAMNERTRKMQKENPTISVNTLDTFAVWLNISKIPDNPIIMRFFIDHEFGHLKKNHHFKQLLEEKSWTIFGGVGVMGTLCSCMPKMPLSIKSLSLNTGIFFGLLSVVKVNIDQSDWYGNLRAIWHKKHEFEAHKYALSMSEDPEAVNEYLQALKK